MTYYNLNTSSTINTLPAGYPDSINPQAADHQRHGIRRITPAIVPDGYTVTARSYTDTGDGETVQEIILTQLTTEYDAEQAAAAVQAATDAKDAAADPSTWPTGIKEGILTVAEQVEKNKGVTRQICTILLNKGVVTQAQYDNAVAQIPAMNQAAYAAAWRARMDT